MKKKIYKAIRRYLVVLLVFTAPISSCDMFELDLLDSPNALSSSNADVDYFINSIQLNFVYFYRNINRYGSEVTRMIHFYGPTYTNGYSPDALNTAWGYAYSSILTDIRTMNELAEANNLYTHIGMGQVIESYIMLTLVDYFGDVPYSQALDANNLNPGVDAGADIYVAVESLLDAAIANFESSPTYEPDVDLYYDNDKTAWIKLANTLKLKMYLNERLVEDVTSKINAIVSSGNYIASSEDDFKFQYSTTDSDPDSRHPRFTANYKSGVSDYMADYYMDLLLNSYSVADPRIRYYFYRQVNDYSGANSQTKECVNESAPSHYSSDEVFCEVGDGYWGRDHGDDDGIPPDDAFRTTWGVYPAGGRFDDNSAETLTSDEVGLYGAGIEPIMMSSYVDFMLAEAALTEGTSGSARTYFEEGINKSITTVMNFGESVADEDYVPSDEEIADYVDQVMSEFDTGSAADQLDLIIHQYMIALWGNGIEIYNAYRRTGKPADLQPTLLKDPGNFIRTFYYPSDCTDNNSSISQKELTVQVFWDNNPAGFID